MNLDGLMPLPENVGGRTIEPTTIQDPRREREVERERWEKEAARWRTLELARTVFGEEETRVEVASYPARGDFHGLLRVSIPFNDLEEHRDREAVFTELAGRDELLARVPMVFVFDPVPVAPSVA